MDDQEFKRQNREHDRNRADAVNSDFLDGIGEGKFTAAPVQWDSVEGILIKYGKLFMSGYADELSAQDVDASGFLSSSMRFEFVREGKLMEARVFMASYSKFVDQGVQGLDKTRNVAPTSPYSFKFAFPSRKHIENLEKWIKEKNVTAVITVPKGIKDTLLKPKSLAYAIGYNVKQKGIKPTYFKSKVMEKLFDKFKSEIKKAAAKDIKVNILFE